MPEEILPETTPTAIVEAVVAPVVDRETLAPTQSQEDFLMGRMTHAQKISYLRTKILEAERSAAILNEQLEARDEEILRMEESSLGFDMVLRELNSRCAAAETAVHVLAQQLTVSQTRLLQANLNRNS